MSQSVPDRATVDPVSVLLVGVSTADRDSLAKIFRPLDWRLRTAVTTAEAARHVSAGAVPVIITERDAEEGSWRSLLATFGRSPRSPRLIVSSRLADERLWAEVLNLGGFDVVSTPFEPKEVRHVVSHAWRSWHWEWGARPGPAPITGVSANTRALFP